MKSKNGNRLSIVLAFCFVTVFLLATQGAIVFLYNETYVYDYAILDKVNQLYNVAIKGSCILAIGVFLFSVYCLTASLEPFFRRLRMSARYSLL